MKNEIFITEILYKNNIFKIYMTDGQIEVKTINKNVSYEIIEELKKLVYDENKILEYNRKKFFLSSAIVISAGLFLGTFSNKDLIKISNTHNIYEKLQIDEDINIYQGSFFIDYMNAVNSNINLSKEDKKIFIERYNYIKENKNNINTKELFSTLKNIKIIRHANQETTILGNFIIKDGMPIINLYPEATEESLIHEIYHALKYNKYYWDKVYYFNDEFIGTDDYELLTTEEKNKCLNYNILGNMIEEAHTSILTAYENDTEKLDIPYKEEVYIYKIYEDIFGKENMEKCMLQPNQVVGFLNNLLNIGCTKEEAIAITARLDLYNTFTYNRTENDLSYLKYQICDDLAYVYNKKYNNIENPLLKTTILSIINNINMELVNNYDNTYKIKELSSKIEDYKLSIAKHYFKDADTIYKLEKIWIDYFSENEPLIYFKTITGQTLTLEIRNNEITNPIIYKDKKTNEYINNLYDSYYEFAMNQYNDENYANFFACIYANFLLNENQKGEILTYYDACKNFKDEEIKNLLLLNDYDQIENYFSNLKIDYQK